MGTSIANIILFHKPHCEAAEEFPTLTGSGTLKTITLLLIAFKNKLAINSEENIFLGEFSS